MAFARIRRAKDVSAKVKWSRIKINAQRIYCRVTHTHTQTHLRRECGSGINIRRCSTLVAISKIVYLTFNCTFGGLQCAFIVSVWIHNQTLAVSIERIRDDKLFLFGVTTAVHCSLSNRRNFFYFSHFHNRFVEINLNCCLSAESVHRARLVCVSVRMNQEQVSTTHQPTISTFHSRLNFLNEINFNAITYKTPEHRVHTNEPTVILTYVGPRWSQSKHCLFPFSDTSSRRIFKFLSSCFFRTTAILTDETDENFSTTFGSNTSFMEYKINFFRFFFFHPKKQKRQKQRILLFSSAHFLCSRLFSTIWFNVVVVDEFVKSHITRSPHCSHWIYIYVFSLKRIYSSSNVSLSFLFLEPIESHYTRAQCTQDIWLWTSQTKDTLTHTREHGHGTWNKQISSRNKCGFEKHSEYPNPFLFR